MKKQVISFVPAVAPIDAPVTKFGGDPAWVEKPEWPLSRATGRPMRFIGQIALSKEIFGETPCRLAYLFMTQDEEYVDDTWEFDGGENAVVLQPGGHNIPTEALKTGPTLYAMEAVKGERLLQEVPREYECTLDLRDEDSQPAMSENKIGGVPAFLQGDEYPAADGRKWQLLLQLDSSSAPFYVNFGDAGIGYAFLSDDGRSAKFMWQCC